VTCQPLLLELLLFFFLVYFVCVYFRVYVLIRRWNVHPNPPNHIEKNHQSVVWNVNQINEVETITITIIVILVINGGITTKEIDTNTIDRAIPNITAGHGHDALVKTEIREKKDIEEKKKSLHRCL
jgi:NADH:ubiquinone oxidoreductase subunit 4 (subunit M)